MNFPRQFHELTLDDLELYCEEQSLPRYRARQIFSWVYQKGAISYDEMTNLPKKLRQKLTEDLPLYIPELVDKQTSRDGSRKYVLRLYDGKMIELVGMPSYDTHKDGSPARLTVCFSTQVGCAMACSFCATGREGLSRNLFPGEIAAQVMFAARDFRLRISNVVAMGQGEPFMNYDNLLKGLRIINHPDALNIGARHITVSTCGIPQKIRQFGREPEQFTLAISLHSALQDTRAYLMPKAAQTSVDELKSAIQDYIAESGRRISFEYLLSRGTNDTEQHLQALCDYCSDLKAHVNLIPVNAVEGSILSPSTTATLEHWRETLCASGTETSIRVSRGQDIDGACGQLKNKLKNKALK